MLEQLDTKLDQQEKEIKELKNLLHEEVQQRRQADLKITKLEEMITEWRSQLQQQLTATFSELFENLSQVGTHLQQHVNTTLGEVYQNLTLQQVELGNKIDNCLDAKLNILHREMCKRLNMPPPNVVEAKLAKLEITPTAKSVSNVVVKTEEKLPSKSIGVVPAISNTGRLHSFGNVTPSTSRTNNNNSVTSQNEQQTTRACYVNWDSQIRTEIIEKNYVSYKELDAILQQVTSIYSWNVTPELMNSTRVKIKELKVFPVNKHNRFPTNGNYVDINLKSDKNKLLLKIFTETGLESFHETVKEYRNVMKNNAPDLFVFENSYDLKWSHGYLQIS